MAWTTTFHYEQELRSTYMNNIQTGVLKPGIYNPNFTLYAQQGEGANIQDRGVWLEIGEGTTLIFSNGYRTEGGVLRRDLNRVGSYVVKCTCTATYRERLADPAATGGSQEFLRDIDGATLCPLKFVIASFTYLEESTASIIPDFSFAISEQHPTLAENVSLRIPNEGFTPGQGNAQRSFLIVGVAIDTNMSARQDYVLGQEWKNGTGFNGAQEWNANHIFTGRGLPEYRGALSKNYTAPAPDFIFSRSYNRSYLSSGQFYFNSILYNVNGFDWRQVYEITQAAPSAPTLGIGWVVDHKPSSPEVSVYDVIDQPELAPAEDQVVLDFYFLGLRSEYNRSAAEDLSGLLVGSTFNAGTQRVLHYRAVVTPPSLDGWAFRTIAAPDRIFGQARATVPLDISMRNIERLKSLIANRNVLLPVINNMRVDPTIAPFLNAQQGQSLLPIAITFRLRSADPAVRDIQSGDSSRVCADKDGVFGSDLHRVGTVNPANVLSFFDLQATSYAVFGASLSAQEVFETLPFLD